MEPLHYFHVNWVDGMKITKDHFIALENVYKERINDIVAARLNDNNYGLLPPLKGEDSSLNMELIVDNQERVIVKLDTCRAITRNGVRIEIGENNPYSNDYSVTLPRGEMVNNAMFYLIISIEPFKLMPVGDSDPTEEPPRHPFALPQVKIHLIEEQELMEQGFGGNFLTIGKVKVTNSKPELVLDYIPPCCSVQSFPQLKTLHTSYDRFFSQMEIYMINIIQKTKEKEQTNELATTIKFLTEGLLHYVSSNLISYRRLISDRPPIEMIEKVSSLARVMTNTINANTGKAKEELLNYLSEWCQLKQGELVNVLERMVGFQYKHTRIQETVDLTNQFVEVADNLFSKLSALEYIGKKKETGIFVKEQPGKTSFLAD